MQIPLNPSEHRVAVLGASSKPDRYAYQALRLLNDKGYQVLPIHPKIQEIDQIPVVPSLEDIVGQVHTLTLYVGPKRSLHLISAILALAPGRVILNPGTESPALEQALAEAGIPYERACTLVLLRTGQF